MLVIEAFWPSGHVFVRELKAPRLCSNSDTNLLHVIIVNMPLVPCFLYYLYSKWSYADYSTNSFATLQHQPPLAHVPLIRSWQYSNWSEKAITDLYLWRFISSNFFHHKIVYLLGKPQYSQSSEIERICRKMVTASFCFPNLMRICLTCETQTQIPKYKGVWEM